MSEDSAKARWAAGIVQALAGGSDTVRCSDCGQRVDVSDAETEPEVVSVLARHQQEVHDDE